LFAVAKRYPSDEKDPVEGACALPNPGRSWLSKLPLNFPFLNLELLNHELFMAYSLKIVSKLKKSFLLEFITKSISSFETS